MMELNALTPTLTPLTGPDLFSLIPTLPALEAPLPVDSINPSAPIELDFSALLTEMMGTVEEEFEFRNPNFEIPLSPALREGVDARPIEFREATLIRADALVEEKEETDPSTTPSAAHRNGTILLMPQPPLLGEEGKVKPQQPANTEKPHPIPQHDPIWAEVRKFELTVRHEVREPQKPMTPTEPAKAAMAMITSDPVVNAQQPQLPLRVIAIEKVAIQTRLQDHGPKESDPAPTTTESTATPAVQFSEVARMPETVTHVEQARAAHHVEIPNVPHVQVVRTVALEVGDADSQVVIRIQERGGDLQLQFNAASEPLHRDLQSSVGSLVHALRREDIQVSSVEVSKKAPVDKVRRMKEAH